MRKLKIGILGTRGIPNNYGGFEQFAQKLSLSLIKRGHDVFVYNSSLHPYLENEWKGVKIIHCRDWEQRIGTAGQFIYDLNSINDARTRGFDILLHLGYTSDSVWYARWPKAAINIVNMDGLEWKRSKYSRPVQRFLKWAESLAAKNADERVADSKAIRDYLLSAYNVNSVFIPYGAEKFSDPTSAVLNKYNLLSHQYHLVIARMEPENNLEMIIGAHRVSRTAYPLFIVGNITNSYGRYLTGKYRDESIRFSDVIFDQNELNNLRYHSAIYFHGHSVGGTNPSLLEAMACSCRIAAHDNPFNRAVLHNEAHYFQDISSIVEIINGRLVKEICNKWRDINLKKIETIYHPEKIADAYEELMISAYLKRHNTNQAVSGNTLAS